MGITNEQALDCFRSDDLIGIGMEADAVRRTLHPQGVVSYTVQRPVDCSATPEELFLQVAKAEEAGATGLVLMNAAEAGLNGLTARMEAIRERFPALRMGGVTASSILKLSEGGSIPDILKRLSDAGLAWLGGGDANISGVQDEWFRVHRAAHAAGLRSAAAMIFGQGETLDRRVAHLEALRTLHADTGGFFSLTPAAFRPVATGGVRSLEEATSVEYLRTLAICRMYLDEIENVQASWETEGVKVLQMSLRFGANDAGSSSPESGSSEEDLRRIIRDAGFRPVERDGLYGVRYLD